MPLPLVAFPEIVTKNVTRFESIFKTVEQRKHFCEYVTGLIAGEKATVQFSYQERGVNSPQKADGFWLINTKTGVPHELNCTLTAYLGNPRVIGELSLIRT